MDESILRALLRQARTDLDQLIAELPKTERARDGAADRWALKDVLVHLTFWQQHSLEIIEAARHNQTPPQIDAFQEANAQTFAKNQHRLWEDVHADFERVSAELVREIARLTAADLALPGNQSGTPLWQRILGNSYSHFEEHLASWYINHGEKARGLAAAQTSAARLERVITDPVERGNTRYNLACFYALNGLSDQALPLLRESLSLNPKLVEWSKQDSDLDSLRELPDYKTIYS